MRTHKTNMAALRELKTFAALCMVFQCLQDSVSDDKPLKVPVKIVEEPAVYRGVNTYYQQHHSTMNKVLTPRVEPIAFSGPPHLAVLNGMCFTLVHEGYKYELCPFHNITQQEQTVRWNAFHGILGVWQGWVIVNNTFNSMLMSEGDYCPHNIPRQTKVFLKCGNIHKVISVKEPSTCHYEMIFETPLGCPEDAMLVYPALSPEGRSSWEEIEEGLWREELTSQGYDKRRKKLFLQEGLVASGDRVVMAEKSVKSVVERSVLDLLESKQNAGDDRFLTKEQCSKAYVELLAEVNRLRKLVSPFGKEKLGETLGGNVTRSKGEGDKVKDKAAVIQESKDLKFTKVSKKKKLEKYFKGGKLKHLPRTLDSAEIVVKKDDSKGSRDYSELKDSNLGQPKSDLRKNSEQDRKGESKVKKDLKFEESGKKRRKQILEVGNSKLDEETTQRLHLSDYVHDGADSSREQVRPGLGKTVGLNNSDEEL